MPKFRELVFDWRLSISIFFMLFTINASDFLVGDRLAFAQSSNPVQKSPIIKSRKPSSNGWLIEKIVELLRPTTKKPSRGDGIVCADSPVFKSQYSYLWTRQPLFVWTGTAKSVLTIDATSKQVIWSKEVDANAHQLKIDRPLELGKRYIWRVVAEADNDAVNPEVAFQMVDVNQWRKIDRELKALEQRLKGQKLNSDEIILEKVKYFAQYQMWGDAQETLAVLPNSLNQKQQLIDLKEVIKEELSLCLHNSINTPPPNEKK
jgi:hypothetical protein